MERRLAAIMATDVVGYSRLIRADEEGTIAALQALRVDLVDPKIAEHHGRIVKLMGDGMLVEFASVVDAVHAAVETQQAMIDHNAEVPADKRIELRIGINLGDVVIDGDDIQGDGVNVAARLEGIAEPGGICVSGMVYEGVRDRIDVPFEDLGEQTVKNIDRPIRVWRWSEKVTGNVPTASSGMEALPLPDKPSIAVLPFTNMSGDPEQEYFSDGITEDIITELSRFGVLYVVALNSSFAFKEKAVSIQEIGRKLGVHYVVEGSVRRAGNRVRITAQLIEAETGNHIWAERYDRELEDIFTVQDEVTRSIVGVLPGRVEEAVAERASRKRTDNMKAYELLLKGKSIRDSFSTDGTAKARELFEKAIELDPRYAKAHAYLADTYFMDLFMGVATADAPQRSLHHARTAMELDSSDVANHDQLGFAYIGAGLWEDAAGQFDRALSKVVVEAEPMTWIGYGLLMLGRAEEAREVVMRAIQLNPLHPPSFYWVLGQACYFAKRHEEVTRIMVGRALLNSFAYACLAGAYGQLGRRSKARVALEDFVRERHREFDSRDMVVTADTIDVLAGGYRRMWRHESDWEHLADGLRKAGLPE